MQSEAPPFTAAQITRMNNPPIRVVAAFQLVFQRRLDHAERMLASTTRGDDAWQTYFSWSQRLNELITVLEDHQLETLIAAEGSVDAQLAPDDLAKLPLRGPVQ